MVVHHYMDTSFVYACVRRICEAIYILLYIFIMMNAIYSVLRISSVQISCCVTTYGFGRAL